VQGEGLQRQTAQQQCGGDECQGKGKALTGNRANQHQKFVDWKKGSPLTLTNKPGETKLLLDPNWLVIPDLLITLKNAQNIQQKDLETERKMRPSLSKKSSQQQLQLTQDLSPQWIVNMSRLNSLY